MLKPHHLHLTYQSRNNSWRLERFSLSKPISVSCTLYFLSFRDIFTLQRKEENGWAIGQGGHYSLLLFMCYLTVWLPASSSTSATLLQQFWLLNVHSAINNLQHEILSNLKFFLRRIIWWTSWEKEECRVTIVKSLLQRHEKLSDGFIWCLGDQEIEGMALWNDFTVTMLPNNKPNRYIYFGCKNMD